jgi:hypothetical protein
MDDLHLDVLLGLEIMPDDQTIFDEMHRHRAHHVSHRNYVLDQRRDHMYDGVLIDLDDPVIDEDYIETIEVENRVIPIGGHGKLQFNLGSLLESPVPVQTLSSLGYQKNLSAQ